MATIRLVPSTYYLSNSTYLSVSNADNMYTNTDSTTYATVTNTTSSTSSYYIYIRGFNFGDVPSNANVTGISIKLKASHSGGNTSTIYGYNGTTQVSTAGSTTALGTTASVKTFTNTTIAWNTLKNYGSDFGIRINCRRSNRNTQATFNIYGAEIEVTYTASTVNVTGVSVSPTTASIDIGETVTLTETVVPANATNKNVTWSSNNNTVATVSGGVVTGVSAGTATITVQTEDGGYTATCAVTVKQPVLKQYRRVNSMEVGSSYILASGNTGTVYMLTGESAGSRLLRGISTTVSNDIIEISDSVASSVLFDCVRFTAGNDVTITVSKNGSYLYSDNASGLRLQSTSSLDRFWHYRDGKFWQFKNTTSDGYTDTSTEFKYYIEWNNGNATDNHVTSPSIEDSNIPLIYIYKEYVPSDNTLYFKQNGSWVAAQRAYKKINGTWVEQSDLTTVFDENTNYIKG